MDRVSKASRLRPQRPESSLGVRSQSLPGCKLQAKLESCKSGWEALILGAWGQELCSLLPGPDLFHATLVYLVYTSSLQMKEKAQRGLVAGPRSHGTQVV